MHQARGCSVRGAIYLVLLSTSEFGNADLGSADLGTADLGTADLGTGCTLRERVSGLETRLGVGERSQGFESKQFLLLQCDVLHLCFTCQVDEYPAYSIPFAWYISIVSACFPVLPVFFTGGPTGVQNLLMMIEDNDLYSYYQGA